MCHRVCDVEVALLRIEHEPHRPLETLRSGDAKPATAAVDGKDLFQDAVGDEHGPFRSRRDRDRRYESRVAEVIDLEHAVLARVENPKGGCAGVGDV